MTLKQNLLYNAQWKSAGEEYDAACAAAVVALDTVLIKLLEEIKLSDISNDIIGLLRKLNSGSIDTKEDFIKSFALAGIQFNNIEDLLIEGFLNKGTRESYMKSLEHGFATFIYKSDNESLNIDRPTFQEEAKLVRKEIISMLLSHKS